MMNEWSYYEPGNYDLSARECVGGGAEYSAHTGQGARVGGDDNGTAETVRAAAIKAVECALADALAAVGGLRLEMARLQGLPK